MDRDTFDGILRLLGGAGTRRAALGALLTGVAFVPEFAPDAAAKRGKRRRKKKSNRPKVCYGANACPPPGPGNDFDDCDFAGTDIFVEASAAGSSFRRANFANTIMDDAYLQGTTFAGANLAGASMKGVDIRGATFIGACLLGTDFTGFLFYDGVLGNAILCNTRVDAFTVSNRDCNRLPACCREEDAAPR